MKSKTYFYLHHTVILVIKNKASFNFLVNKIIDNYNKGEKKGKKRKKNPKESTAAAAAKSL